MKRIKRWLLRLVTLPAALAFLLMWSGLAVGKWSGLKLLQHQYHHLNQPNEHTEVLKQEKR